jgi:signal transduction histidine kinase
VPEVRVTVMLAEDAAAALVIGGLPGSRLPWLYALVALSAALAGVAVFQVRRQAQLVRLRSDFVSGVSHQLRTPLAQIRMFAETLALGRVRSAAESRRSLAIIVREAQHLSDLVDNVLCFSRSERGVVSVSRRPVQVQQLLGEVVDALQPLADARGVIIRCALVDAFTCLVDAAALRQMLLNLVDNALKYGPTGQTITISAVRVSGLLRFTVEDEGPGIPDEISALIWEPFWRAPGSAEGGSGIGLAVVRDLTAAHQGRAFVDTSVSRGARFVIELPDAA